MKKLFIPFLLLLAVGATATAIEIPEYKEGRSAYLQKSGTTHDNDDDRNPGPQSIICHYSSESITLNFPADVECITISIGPEYAPIWTGAVTAGQPTAQLPAITGEQRISCQTDTDILYSGYLTF